MSTGDSSSQEATPGSIAGLTLDWARASQFPYWFARETTSTNTIAKSRVSSAGAPSRAMLLLTERQTAGRGRGDHTWTTPPNALLSTWSFPLNFAPQPILSPLAGLALYDAASRAFTDVAFSLKAPNDLYVGDQKIAGLLIETVIMGSQITCAVGLGFNAGAGPSGVESAVGLATLLPEMMIRRAWPTFLSAWQSGLQEALEQARANELSEATRIRLVDALNLHAGLREKVLSVGPLGQLQTSSRLINWNEL